MAAPPASARSRRGASTESIRNNTASRGSGVGLEPPPAPSTFQVAFQLPYSLTGLGEFRRRSRFLVRLGSRRAGYSVTIVVGIAIWEQRSIRFCDRFPDFFQELMSR